MMYRMGEVDTVVQIQREDVYSEISVSMNFDASFKQLKLILGPDLCLRRLFVRISMAKYMCVFGITSQATLDGAAPSLIHKPK